MPTAADSTTWNSRPVHVARLDVLFAEQLALEGLFQAVTGAVDDQLFLGRVSLGDVRDLVEGRQVDGLQALLHLQLVLALPGLARELDLQFAILPGRRLALRRRRPGTARQHHRRHRRPPPSCVCHCGPLFLLRKPNHRPV